MNYTERLLRAMTELKLRGKVFAAEVAHDDWCAIYERQECNCNPDITISDGCALIVRVDGEGHVIKDAR